MDVSRPRGLATEARFEYAPRGGEKGRVYPWGDAATPHPESGNFCDEAFRRAHPASDVEILERYDDGFAGLAPVRSFLPNAYGVYDLAGNAWEWCRDRYAAQRPARVRPQRRHGGAHATVGFRCARSLP